MDPDRWSPIAPGTTLGSYRIERTLGRGGMGVVYLAYDTTLHRQVALKIIEGSLDDLSSAERLLREARNAAALNHPNICTIHEVSARDRTAFIAMEFVNGRSLGERLDEGTMPLDEALRYGMQAADALEHAHLHGVVHRDFKAANVIVNTESRVKVVDFGLARRTDDAAARETTMASLVLPGQAAGTPYAMAPEQVRAEKADARTDVWALGVLLYEMVAGRKPFAAASVPELFSAILRDQPAPLPGTVPIALRGVIERCLEKNPADRYQRAGDVRDALAAIQSGASGSLPVRKGSSKRRAWLAGAAAAVAAIAVTTGFNLGGVRDRLAIGSDDAIVLAVLPFQNLTGDADQEFFSDGLTDELISQLGRLQPTRLKVIARTSSMRYKQRNVPLDQIARELGVAYVMEGSARREGSRVRISATLIQVRDQTQRWSDSFERELANILSVQSDIARGVARALAITLLPAEQNRLASVRPVNPDAYEAYLRGRFHWQALLPKDLEVAMHYFESAVQQDPSYAPAYTGMGTVWGLRCYRGIIACRQAHPKWKESILKAKALDPDLPEIQSQVAAIAYYVDWDWDAADREFRRAVDVDAANPDAHMWYADYLASVAGRYDEGLAAGRRAIELDPNNYLYQARFGITLVAARRDDEAIALLQKLLQIDPSRRGAGVLGLVLARKGKFDEAFEIMRQQTANNPELTAALEQAYSEGGYRRAVRVRADMMARQAEHTYVAPYSLAAFYARAGESDEAMKWLEKAFDDRDTQLLNLKVAPTWDLVRDDPRFQVMLRRMNFPD